ncbi:MAG: DUF3656 domain-containing protein [Actinomycetota bacterium]|nr:DUF3656 domain-containing protein [Actinomycetota bacterium]MDP9485322.1 DUF3656 domain-containing protein [Actinomycetota bacterium]
MISIEEARRIVRGLVAERIARLTWHASVGADGEAYNAAAILDLGTGKVVYHSWRRDLVPVANFSHVVLSQTSATRREDVEADARRSASVPPSDDVVEEGVAQAAAKKGLDMNDIERQLRRAYEVLGEGAA